MTNSSFVPVIGLVGGLGSGKSAVARWLGERKRVLIIDGDVVGHRVLQEKEVQFWLRSRFGDAVFDREGNVDRKALGRKVFGTTPDLVAARVDLESTVHPRIRKEMSRQIVTARSSGNIEAILLDAAVLLEAGWDDLCDAVVFVDAPEECRHERIVRNRGWTEEDLDRREASQLSLEAKRAKADFQIDNSGDFSVAGNELEQIVAEVARRQE